MKKTVFWIILILISLGLLEGTAFIGLSILKETHRIADYSSGSYSSTKLAEPNRQTIQRLLAGENHYLTYSKALGWSIKPNGDGGLYRANAAGIRANQDYPHAAPDGVTRIAALGDSFTHGDDVTNEQTWAAYLQAAQANLEVLNFGVPAYGLDQAYLRYLEDGVQYQPDIVLIGFMSENIFRNVNVFRPFYLPHDGLSFSKPRFDIKAGEFILLPNPLQSLDDYRELLENPAEILPQLGSHDYFYQIQHKEGALANLPFPKLATMRLIKTLNYQLMNRSNIIAYNWHNVGQANEYQSDEYNPESNAFQVTTAIFDAFVQAVKQNNAVPVIVLFPNQPDAKRYRQNGSQIYAPLKAYLDQQQYAYIDTITLFADKSKPLEDLFKGHYSPLANQLVAAEIHRYLQDRVF